MFGRQFTRLDPAWPLDSCPHLVHVSFALCLRLSLPCLFAPERRGCAILQCATLPTRFLPLKKRRVLYQVAAAYLLVGCIDDVDAAFAQRKYGTIFPFAYLPSSTVRKIDGDLKDATEL